MAACAVGSFISFVPGMFISCVPGALATGVFPIGEAGAGLCAVICSGAFCDVLVSSHAAEVRPMITMAAIAVFLILRLW